MTIDGSGMEPLGISGLSTRPLDVGDAEALHGLLIDSARADGNADEVPAPDELRHDYYTAPGAHLSRDSIAVFTDDGDLVGMSWARARLSNVQRMGRVNLWGTVRPDHRRRGIGRWLLARGENRAREQLLAVPDQLPSRIDCDALDHQEDRKALFAAAGFSPIRSYARMSRTLVEPVDLASVHGALRIATWSSDLDEATREAHNDAFQDHFSYEPVPANIWRFRYSASSSFLPDLSYLALSGDLVVGYVMSGAQEADRAVPGGPQAFLATIGVRQGFRRRGVASALMTRTMRAFREAGYRKAVLDVDSENATGAVGLYERHGFTAISTSVLFSKHLPPQARSSL